MIMVPYFYHHMVEYLMKFKGPCTLYYQGRNLHELTSFIGGIAVDYAGKR
jgi:hypothetical protein